MQVVVASVEASTSKVDDYSQRNPYWSVAKNVSFSYFKDDYYDYLALMSVMHRLN